jgi:diguanylate cyclase (GGDEF)-like protein
MIDLDDFKLVNDTFGHQLGDSVLVYVADLIRSTLRATDVAARYGGDEFAVILPDSDRDAVRAAAERIVAALAERPFSARGRGPIAVGASVGIAVHPADGRTGAALIAAADGDLYRAKRAGRPAVPARAATRRKRQSDVAPTGARYERTAAP